MLVTGQVADRNVSVKTIHPGQFLKTQHPHLSGKSESVQHPHLSGKSESVQTEIKQGTKTAILPGKSTLTLCARFDHLHAFPKGTRKHFLRSEVSWCKTNLNLYSRWACTSISKLSAGFHGPSKEPFSGVRVHARTTGGFRMPSHSACLCNKWPFNKQFMPEVHAAFFVWIMPYTCICKNSYCLWVQTSCVPWYQARDKRKKNKKK